MSAAEELRSHFLDRRRKSAEPATLNAVAHMLLELDRPERVMAIGLKHLGVTVAAGRVDLGFGSVVARHYSACAEYKEDGDTPTLVGRQFSNTEAMIQRVWKSSVPIAYNDIPNQPFSRELRGKLAATGSKAILAQRLTAGERAFGIVCVDELNYRRSWTEAEKRFVHSFCSEFLAPILGICRSFPQGIQRLSPGVLEAVRLAAEGFTHQEIAELLEEPIQVVMFRLRDARFRLGARSQAELLQYCAAWI